MLLCNYSWNQQLRVVVVCKRRNTEKLLIIHAFDGTDYVQLKSFNPLIDHFKEIFKVTNEIVKN